MIRVQGTGFRVESIGSSVQGLAFRVHGSEFGVQSLW